MANTKKILIIFSVLALMQMPIVNAAPLNVSGDVNVLYERVNPDANSTENNNETTFRLTLEQPLSSQWSAFFRYGYRSFGGDNNEPKLSKLDQYGLKYSPDQSTSAVFGVQDAMMGAYGATLDLTDNIGDGMLAGVNIQNENEGTIYHFLAGRLDKKLFAAEKAKTAYGLEIGREIKDTAITGQYLSVNDLGAADKFYGLSIIHPYGKAEFLAEYVRSNAGSGKNGMVYGVNYNLTDKDALGLTLHRLEANASPEGLGGYDNDTKAVELSWDHTFGKAGTLTISYERAKTLSDGTKANTASLEYNIQF